VRTIKGGIDIMSYRDKWMIETIKKAEDGDPEELERLYEDPDNAERLDWMMRGEESIEERNGW